MKTRMTTSIGCEAQKLQKYAFHSITDGHAIKKKIKSEWLMVKTIFPEFVTIPLEWQLRKSR